jgi:hypothetical protein
MKYFILNIKFQIGPSTIPKPTTNNSQPQKRHIMISYNHSSRETCQKIYDGLVVDLIIEIH